MVDAGSGFIVGHEPIATQRRLDLRGSRLWDDWEAELENLETERLRLRLWRDEDLEPFAAMNSDKRVMEYFPALYDRAKSDAGAKTIRDRFGRDGYGLFAVEIKGGPSFAGFIGFSPVELDVSFTPAVEIGWRVAFSCWGKGYATEGARACLAFGRDHLGFDEVVSFTAVENQRSRAVMDRVGMTHNDADDFDHPQIQRGHRLRRHVLYRKRLNERA